MFRALGADRPVFSSSLPRVSERLRIREGRKHLNNSSWKPAAGQILGRGLSGRARPLSHHDLWIFHHCMLPEVFFTRLLEKPLYGDVGKQEAGPQEPCKVPLSQGLTRAPSWQVRC